MKKTLLTLVAAFYATVALFAQTPTQRVCGTLQHHQYLQQTRPNYVSELNQYNQAIEQYLANQAANPSVNRASAIITIPVVVHVVYNTAAENISDAQAASQVQVLNDDFAKLNTDANKVTQPTFSTVAAGSQIRFCLAQRDPNGNATTGIVHKSTATTSFGTNDAVKANATGGDAPWDVTKYVNIWICDLTGTLLGYGEFPTGTISQTWGLVIDYAYAGSGGSATAPFNLGRTGTHEFGHCFNLNHIWGDDGTACSGTDNCADTPNQAGEHYGCFPQGSIQTDGCSASSPGTMWMNYMDYTDDACMYMFTANQVARMEAVVNTVPWNILQTSLGCTPVSALDAGVSSVIAPVNGSSTCNNSVTPKITLNNYGSTTLTSAIINYKMDALATQTLNWTGSLASTTSTVLTLNAYAGLTNAAHTFSVWVASPNGGTDQNSANNSMSSTFTVVSAPVGQALPFTERFDATTFPPTGWVKSSTNTLNAANTWTRVANTTGIPVVPTTTACARMDNYTGTVSIVGQKDALRTPALSFTGANSSLNVTFDVSHKMYSATDIDTLNVFISTDCGGTWTNVYTKGGTQLSTSTGTSTAAYTPTANSQWRRETVSLSSYAGQPSVYLKFESRSGWGNYVYLDNVNVSYTTAAAAPVASFSTAATKCSGSAISFSDQSTNTPTSWTWSFPGGTPSTSTVQNPSVTYTTGGTYTVTLTSANASGTSTAVSQTITVNATPTVAASNASICIGSSASLAATGATTYSWNTGATTSSISVTPTVTTNYTVIGTTSGCVNTKTLSVTVNPTPTVAITNATICSGASANLTATGATSYSWNTGATTASVSVTPTLTTTYSVIGTTNGCTNTKTVSVTVNSIPTVAVSNATVCSGNAANLAATGATTYSWNTGATTSSISVTPTVTSIYTVTGTNTVGCANTKTVSVTVNALPNVAVSSTTICAGSTGTLVASGASTYTWNTGAIGANAAVSPSVNTTYTVTGTSAAGCVKTATASVTVGSAPSIAVNSTTVCSGNSTTLSASGVTTYTWNTGATSSSISVTPASSIVYTVTGNLSGCTATATKTVSVTVNTTPTVAVSNATVCSGTPANLAASGATSYLWNTGATTSSISVTPTVTSNYTVTGTTNGCVNTKTLSVTVKLTPTVTVNSPTICSGASASLNASGATTYNWSTGPNSPNITVSPTVTTNYTVTGTTSGCSNAKTVTVTVNSTPTVAVSNATICSGTSTNLIASGATTYFWSTGATTSSISVSPVSTTNYTVTGSNSGCNNVKTVTVTVKATPTVAVNSSTICSGTAASLIASGATAYSWNTGALTSSISVTPSITTNYTVTGTTNGCANTKTTSVVVNTTPTVAVSNATLCSGSSANLSASGATSYSWNTGATTSAISVTPLVNTTYTVTGSNGSCVNTKTVSVSVNSTPTVAVNSATVCAGTSTNLIASGASTYSWNTGATTSSISVNPSATTVYTITGTSLGCSNSQVATVVVNALPVVSVSNVTICAGSTGTLSASGASTYSWNTGATSSNLIDNPVTTTTYTVTGTSVDGCDNITTATISVVAAPSISVNSAVICAGSTATLTASGVTTYTWNTTSNSSTIFVNPTSTSIYTVSGNLNGCGTTAIQEVTVTVNALPNVSLASIAGPLCVNNAAVTLVGSPAGGVYSGTGVSGSSFDPAVSGSGTFTLTYGYTDANTCSASATQTVDVSLCTGIQEIVSDMVSVFPNPTRELIHIKMDASIVNHATVELYDAIGKLVISEKVNHTTTTLNLVNYASGMYTIRVVADGKQNIIKVIRE
jgi:PKD repeat protein